MSVIKYIHLLLEWVPAKLLVQMLSFLHQLHPFLSGHLLQELVSKEISFTPSDVERALWSSALGLKVKLKATKSNPDSEIKTTKNSKRKRKHWFDNEQWAAMFLSGNFVHVSTIIIWSASYLHSTIRKTLSNVVAILGNNDLRCSSF